MMFNKEGALLIAMETNAAKIDLVDAGGYYAVDEVESALQELGHLTALTVAEVDQLENIDAVTISTTQWGALGDYEEGTFTAELRGAGARATTPVQITATYTRIGDLVMVVGSFENANTTGASGQLQIVGLPFTIKAGMSGAWAVGNVNKISFTAGNSIRGYYNAGDTKLLGTQMAVDGTAANWNLTATTGVYLYFVTVYKV